MEQQLIDPSECIPVLELDPRGERTLTSTKYLLTHLPDLQLFKHPHRSGAISFASDKAINGLEEAEFFVRNHDDGQSLELWLYSTIEGHQVYAKPPFYEVGRSHQGGFGFVQHEDALKRIEELGLRFKLRKEIKLFLDSKAAIVY